MFQIPESEHQSLKELLVIMSPLAETLIPRLLSLNPTENFEQEVLETLESFSVERTKGGEFHRFFRKLAMSVCHGELSEVIAGLAELIETIEDVNTQESLVWIEKLIALPGPYALRANAITGTLENVNVLQDFSLISQVRYVTDDDAIPLGGIVTHTLGLRLGAGQQEKQSIFVTLDHGDLEKLSEQIELAKQRHQRLRQLVKDGSLADLTLE